MIFGVPESSLRLFCQNNKKMRIINLPLDEYRLREEELAGNDADSNVSTQEGRDSKTDEQEQANQAFVMLMSTDSSAAQQDEDDPDRDIMTPKTESVAQEGDFQALKREFRRASTLRSKDKTVNLEDFEVELMLGQGAFGKVYLASLKGKDYKYAIKAIRKDKLLELDQIESVALEKDILFESDHPFLSGMEYLFQSDARLYFVMPFIGGGELFKVQEKEKRFPESTVIFYGTQLIMGIGQLHKMGFIHRDLKLENVMLDTDGYVKIIDYGLAKMLNEGELANSICGTPIYLAPEIVQSQPYDKTVDWWAIGIMMYEMLVGIPPFRG